MDDMLSISSIDYDITSMFVVYRLNLVMQSTCTVEVLHKVDKPLLVSQSTLFEVDRRRVTRVA